jgi:hypothetical protein
MVMNSHAAGPLSAKHDAADAPGGSITARRAADLSGRMWRDDIVIVCPDLAALRYRTGKSRTLGGGGIELA